jgi:hypothetical protein
MEDTGIRCIEHAIGIFAGAKPRVALSRDHQAASKGWTKAGLELFKNNELDYARGQYGSTFLSQLVLNIAVPEIAGVINTSIEGLFYQVGGDVTSVINAQEEDLTT